MPGRGLSPPGLQPGIFDLVTDRHDGTGAANEKEYGQRRPEDRVDTVDRASQWIAIEPHPPQNPAGLAGKGQVRGHRCPRYGQTCIAGNSGSKKVCAVMAWLYLPDLAV